MKTAVFCASVACASALRITSPVEQLAVLEELMGASEGFVAPAQRHNAVSRSSRAARVGKSSVAMLDTSALSRAADESRGLAMDSIAAAKSGHLGLPLGAAEIGAVLYGDVLQQNPEDPQWLNRDRFVLSAGHGSMFLYSWLHLAGYDLPKDELKRFRQHHSMTPGHPEFPSSEHNTPGIESTTGPLGQGVSNAVGMAAAAKMAAARFNTPEHKIIDHHIFALCGDGCMQEGVFAEAAAFAGHEGLDNLIVMYDSNAVTLDKMADWTMSEETADRLTALGWDVVTLEDGHDLQAIKAAVDNAKANKNGKPKMIVCKTEIGRGIPEVAGKTAAHGEGGVKYVDEARKALGLPEEKWYVSPETYDFFGKHREEQKKKYEEWQNTFAAWKSANPELARTLNAGVSKEWGTEEQVLAAIPEFDASKNIATRIAGETVINAVAKAVPLYVSGSADLHGSNKNYIKDAGNYGKPFPGGDKSYAGRNLYFGIREHAMGSIMNGFAYYGIFRISGATFLVFADYMRAPVRVASLSELPVSYIWTHDSIGVGEDGPTHQPVEVVSSMRVMPKLDVYRPCDPEETAAAYAASIGRIDGPTALILTRQNVRTISEVPASVKREGSLKGGYVIRQEKAALEGIIMATGSEVQHAIAAAEKLGDGWRVVSMPCLERFDRQSQAYKDSVLPPSMRNRFAIEAGVTGLWYKYVGMDGYVVGVDRFGFSAPGDIVMKELGMTADNLVEKIQAHSKTLTPA
uniref:transketolase n=1 Tax=Chromera velia CCMP2878 TaxID=1169474 RepID=A0A0G4GMM2_9ALVE|eukprot:Cvel_22580.t1-p1 / transcript=Cvel_22580.t1 / gene=Cvel_22580 / organism=Chromera_velia_CCMP2878 / gene_product=Transketolase, putative / transcript_product=Transketolase, putative / location=Cvel_scaffold2232:24823-28317(+) / protein_length=743 / sequence_SO=supercontig / SO=protein_coding / is_pseudo=false